VTHPNPSTALARVVVDELVFHGVVSVFMSPGSRSGALAIAAAEHPDVELCVVLDERSAAFHALGAARASGGPAVVLCTSGTAPANFFPAIVEADMACVQLVAVSADRPSELRGVGANQTIDQVELFGTKVRAFEELSAPDPVADGNETWRAAVSRVMARSRAPRPGPVQLNVAFREPTVPVTDDGRTVAEVYPYPTPRLRPTGEAGLGIHPTPTVDLPSERGVVVAGDGNYDRDVLAMVARDLGWPVLATALSGMRGDLVVSSYSRILARGVPDDLVPHTVVAIGAIGPDIRLEDLVAAAGNRLRVDEWGRSIDPGRNATHSIVGDPVALLSSVSGSAEPGWIKSWQEADDRARVEIERVLSGADEISGGHVAAALNEIEWGALVVASSLPIREVDAHLRRGGPVFANRGASGIDGFTSTAFGVSSVIPRTLALAGDLSLLHDSNAFLHDGVFDLTIIVIDNGGGGLFDSLPQARHAPQFDRLFVTPPNRDLESLAGLHGARFVSVGDGDSLVAEANASLDEGGVHVIRVPIDRRHDLEMRDQLSG
jgi:2-succinyl-5-enolpyruvyl-6-hydroxy-3-cyclohexene-1-carboxylate synthase